MVKVTAERTNLGNKKNTKQVVSSSEKHFTNTNNKPMYGINQKLTSLKLLMSDKLYFSLN